MASSAHSKDSIVTMDSSTPLSSRPILSNFGKSTESLKTILPLEVKEDFSRAARRRGYPSDSDALRELVMLFTYGPDQICKIHIERITEVARNLSSIVTTCNGDEAA